MIDNPRFDLVAARHGQRLVLILLVVGLALLVLTGWVVATPATTTVTQEVGEEHIETSVSTSATVVQDGLWENGTTLESSPVYTYNDTPELTITAETTLTDSGEPLDEATVTHELAVVYEAERNGEVFWSDRDVVRNETAVVEDGHASTAATVDVRTIRERTTELEQTLDGVGDVSVSIDIERAYETPSNSGMESDATPLTLTGNAYWLEGSHEIVDTNPETAPVEVQESTNTAGVGLLALLAVLSLTGATLVAARSNVDVSDAKRRMHERRYDEWISRGSIPMWIGEHHLELETLEDVVDVAIDTNERVVHDTQRDLFAAVNGDVVYYYSDRGGWGETAWPTVEINHDESAVSETTGQQHPQAPSAHGTTETPEKRAESNPEATETVDVPESEERGEGDEEDTTTEITKTDLPDPDDDDAWEQI
ncbi:uncharacterized protein Nmag_3742 (plasmid) [Natrialba magadii ATCC 43099]|uniref:DUF5305 domain-containing protein n=1 Tax=Natrialba magadii (strain ATCC 43099 / DSM 3394 / CCM 3739 / CIP 104546 / IAM 13178 / JCM 8861 / NBRC 102185 / NCIMB 2190 / MS3) TaxID=547559 RepID=D3T125_NATMM|nr:DUF5305 domain-containing protein [Natrialba magadii]ADD07284.1 uncharacterized protein Nmag_3742 [Natrialba magadii ATCC 43099]ELY32712.1 hypothetical protein C500_03409 [Natrialba magadii ATCC 43099]